eukprot:TRINITY_DN2053_c0_g1_i1.p1 TRINITY_DN2053_c0_g1~~TRINITY_DN2053_c0_g1_i1.p1  ORF type:complete len:106 (-),score=23.68 TRINITY_DN2053_c0_g1_i1:38-355(-)
MALPNNIAETQTNGTRPWWKILEAKGNTVHFEVWDEGLKTTLKGEFPLKDNEEAEKLVLDIQASGKLRYDEDQLPKIYHLVIAGQDPLELKPVVSESKPASAAVC